jgi:hypothetical protein
VGLAIDVDTTGFELVDDLYLVAIIDEGETKVAQCMIYSEHSEAAGRGWKSLESSIPLFCVPDVESQVARKSYVASIQRAGNWIALCWSCGPPLTRMCMGGLGSKDPGFRVTRAQSHPHDMASTRDWKAIPPALDINQPTISFKDGTETQRPNPITNRSSGIGPIPGIEP